MLEEIGLAGQQLISEARILVAGAGGLGNPSATYLAGAGVGTLGIVDGDRVGQSNLHRQFMFTDASVGSSKSGTLAAQLRQLNPGITIHSYDLFLDENNAEEIISLYDIVCDVTDNPESRLLIEQTCARLGKPLVYAAVRNWEGQVTVLNHRQKIRLSDIFLQDQLREQGANACAVAGIANIVCGVAGSIQAGEALKIVLGRETLDGQILCFDALAHVYRKFSIRKPDLR